MIHTKYQKLMIKLVAYNDFVNSRDNNKLDLISSDKSPSIESQRLQEIAERLVKPTKREQFLIFKSKELRNQLIDFKNDYLARLNQSINDDFFTSVLPMAAASNENDEQISIKTNDFNLLIRFDFGHDKPLLHLILNPGLSKQIPEGFSIQIKDGNNRVWLEGKPDENGELLANWPFEDKDVASNLQSNTLFLKVI